MMETYLKVHKIYSIQEIASFQLLTFMIFKNRGKFVDIKLKICEKIYNFERCFRVYSNKFEDH